MPQEIRRWNWGAFLAPAIWGLGNRIYLGPVAVVLILILAAQFIPAEWAAWLQAPVGILLVGVLLGAKGSELAWRGKRWPSVEHFLKVQRRWAWAGLGINVVVIAVVMSLYGTGVLPYGASEAGDDSPAWARHEGVGFEISLPREYSADTDPDALAEALRGQGGAEARELAELLEEFPSFFAFGAVAPGEAGFETNLVIWKFPIGDLTLAQAKDDFTSDWDDLGFEIVEDELVQLGARDAYRIVSEQRNTESVPGPLTKDLNYVLKDGIIVWTLIYTSTVEEFDDLLPEFERSARSFTLG